MSLVDPNGHVKIPSEVLEQLEIEPGDEIKFAEIATGYRIEKQKPETADRNRYWHEYHSRLLKEVIDTDRFNRETEWECIESIHAYVADNVEYGSTRDTILRPDFVVENTQTGDCRDISVVVSTILDILDIPFRIIKVEHQNPNEDDHTMTQAFFETLPQTSYELQYDEIKGGYWVSVDPTFNDKPGERSNYEGKYVDSSTGEYYNFKRLEIEKWA